jgi:hypothetical protein
MLIRIEDKSVTLTTFGSLVSSTVRPKGGTMFWTSIIQACDRSLVSALQWFTKTQRKAP